MKASEIRDLNDADLTARIAELEEERFRLRFRGATEQLEDPLRQRVIRRDIARLKTIQSERARGTAGVGTTGTAKAGASAPKRAAAKAKKSTTKAPAAKKAPTKKAATGAGR